MGNTSCRDCGERPRYTRPNGVGLSYCLNCWNARRKKWLSVPGNRDRTRRSSHRAKIKRQYGVDAETYDTLVKDQRGLCAICEEQPTHFLAVDHDHASNKVRGLLCRGCNLGLGNFKDDPARLVKAAEYLWKDKYG